MVIAAQGVPFLGLLEPLARQAERVMPVSSTAWPWFSSHCLSKPMCVDRPTPSVPSKTISLPLSSADLYPGALRQRS